MAPLLGRSASAVRACAAPGGKTFGEQQIVLQMFYCILSMITVFFYVFFLILYW